MEELPRQTSRRPLSPGEIVAGGIILLVVAVIVILPLLRRNQLKASNAAEDALHPNVQLLINSRYIVGLHQVPLDTKSSTILPTQSLADALKQSAKTPWDLFRAAIVRGEIEGGNSALTELDQLDKQYPELRSDIQSLRPLYARWFPPTQFPNWKNFHDRHAWFADLAASYHKPSTNPLRAATLDAAIRTLFACLAMFLLALAAGVVGLVLFIIAMVLLAKRKIRRSFPITPGLPSDRRVYIEVLAWYLGLYLGLSLFIHYVLHWSGITTAIGLVVAFLTAMLWPLIQGQKWHEYRASFGLHTGKGFLREIASGALGYLTGIPVIAAGFAISYVLIKFSGTDASHPLNQQIGDGQISRLTLVLLAVIWAPITEELMFRGAFFANLRERYGWWTSALVVSLVFAMIHPQGWAGVPALASIALVLAGIREWRGSILASITAHALNNALLTLFLFLAVT